MLKILFLKIAIVLTTFAPFQNQTVVENLKGTWTLQIDKNIDGTASGNLGCPELKIDTHGGTNFTAKYQGCSYTNATFKGIIHTTKKGTLIEVIHRFPSNSYVGILSGHLIKENGKTIIKGVWSNMEGSAGDFKLIKK